MNGHGMDGMNDDEIRDVLAVGLGEEPPIVGGPTAVFAAARARVVRTRVLTGALSTVAVLGVAAGAVAFGTGVGGGGGQSAAGSGAQCAVGPVPPGLGSPTSKASPANEASPASKAPPSPPSSAASPGNKVPVGPTSMATSDPGPGRVLIDPQSQVLRVKQVLPCGTASEFSGYISYHAAPGDGLEVLGHLNVTDRLGVGTVGVELVQNGAWSRDQMKCYPSDIACKTEALNDGTLVKSYQYPVGYPLVGKLFAWTTEVLYPDGRLVVVSSSNYAPQGEKFDNEPTRKVPPLTREQVRGIALDGAWTTTVTKDFAAQAKREITPFVNNGSDPAAASDRTTKG